MIGFYDYTLILTFLSLASSVFGMTQAMDGNFRVAIICLAFSGLCDAFDGKVARTKKNRTDDEVLFGIQLDSLCDVICFGAAPALICYLLGVRGYIGGIAITYYCICSVSDFPSLICSKPTECRARIPEKRSSADCRLPRSRL